MLPRMTNLNLRAVTAFLLTIALITAIAQFGCTADPKASDAGKAPTAMAKSPPASVEEQMVERNGAIFQGWKPPKLALVFTGLQQGYIEPCGCSGKDNQK